MRYFFDTEFIEDGKTIDLISIGIVAEDGRELYLQNQECDWSKASDWVARNVLIGLEDFNMGLRRPCHPNDTDGDQFDPMELGGWWRQKELWRKRTEIGETVRKLVGADSKPEFWAYYAAYDWVVFCQLFGTMMDIPKGFPMYCRDIKQWVGMLGNPKLPEQGKGEHNALEDARWNRTAWEFLNAYNQPASVPGPTVAEARNALWSAMQADPEPGGLKDGYVSNVAMLLCDRYNKADFLDHKTRNNAAKDILELILGDYYRVGASV
jgi:hypothetical protein